MPLTLASGTLPNFMAWFSVANFSLPLRQEKSSLECGDRI